MGNNKRDIALPTIIAVLLILILFVCHFTSSSFHLFGDNKQSTYQQVLELIKNKYVDPVNLDSLDSSAVEELLETLDPHSTYLNPSEVAASTELLKGHFVGIGVEFSLFRDTATIIYVIPGGPGEKAGIKPGDQLLRVNNSSITLKNISTDTIRSLIRGKQNSLVNLSVLRNKKTLQFEVKRERIPLPAIEATYLLDSKTGYIRLERFSETSYEEFMRAIESLKERGVQQLVLDLRGNGGGLLSEAVDIADEFLDQDKLIVYTEGARVGRQEYRARRPGQFEKGKIVLLIDEYSASASEVLAGAIQDWCRGKIIGQSSFGKGLVQEEYSLSNGGALRLTVARYYTPLGRCIQQPYLDGDTIQNSRIFINSCKDTLREENGITPNFTIASSNDTTLLSSIHIIHALSSINQFSFTYYQKNITTFNKRSNPLSLLTDTSLINDCWSEWVRFEKLKTEKYPNYTLSEKQFLTKQILATIARYKWRANGYFQLLNASDTIVRAAINIINQ
jgi:carboxyl-terminal processing protease